jgi:hypothetical protein
VVTPYEVLTKKMSWQQEFFTNFTSCEFASIQPSFLKPLTTITKRFRILEMPEHKDHLLTLSTGIDEAREEYRQRNVNDIQKENGVSGFKISSFVSTTQDNVEEVGDQDTKEGAFVGSAMNNITVGIHSHFDIVYNVQSAL